MSSFQNLKPFTKENAKEMGRRGGIASGKTRKRKAYIRKRLDMFIKIQNYVDSLSNKEFEEFIEEYTVEQQEYIKRIFKPTKKDIKKLLKKYL